MLSTTSRKRARNIRAEQLRVQNHIRASATNIQAHYRGYLVRKRKAHDEHRDKMRNLIALSFQIKYRARKTHVAFRKRQMVSVCGLTAYKGYLP